MGHQFFYAPRKKTQSKNLIATKIEEVMTCLLFALRGWWWGEPERAGDAGEQLRPCLSPQERQRSISNPGQAGC